MNIKKFNNHDIYEITPKLLEIIEDILETIRNNLFKNKIVNLNLNKKMKVIQNIRLLEVFICKQINYKAN